jgi:hypothetical protein
MNSLHACVALAARAMASHVSIAVERARCVSDGITDNEPSGIIIDDQSVRAFLDIYNSVMCAITVLPKVVGSVGFPKKAN